MRKIFILFILFEIICISILSSCAPAIPNGSLPAVETQQSTLAERTIYHTQQGKLTNHGAQNTVTVYTNTSIETDPFTEVYLGVQNGTQQLSYYLGKGLPLAFTDGGGLFLADLDGDGSDEIILFMEISGNGGALAKVFSLQNGQIVLLKDLNDVPLNISVTPTDDFKVCLENPAAGFSKIIDISQEYSKEHFDKAGRFDGELMFFYPEIYMGTVVPTDGLPVIQAHRDVKLTNHLGELGISFQYNTSTKELCVVAICFTE